MNMPEPKPFSTEGPQPLIREMPNALLYPMDALGPLKSVVEALTIVTEAPPALCAASVLAAAGLAAQGLRDAETLGGPRPVSLFLLTIAESGERKRTSDKLAMNGVRDFEDSLHVEYDIAFESYNREQVIWEKRKAEILRSADRNPSATRTNLLDLGQEPEAPLRPFIVAGSPTMEGIIKHLPDLHASLGIMTDEGGLILGYSMKS